jgi:alpha-N-arabinofuranosidase
VKPAYIDTVAMITADKNSIRLSILNRHPTVDYDLDLRFDGFEVSSIEVHEMYSDDLSAVVSLDTVERLFDPIRSLTTELV